MPTSIGAGFGVHYARKPVAGGAPPPPFSPLDFGADLLAWYDASDAATLWQDAGVTPALVTEPVGQWDDKSGALNHMSMTGVTRPTRAATGLVFGGTQKIARATITQGIKPQPFTVAAVGFASSNSTSFWDNGAAGSRNLLQRGAAATTAVLFAGATLTATGQPDLGVRRGVVAEYNGASSAVRVNDGAPFSGNGGANTIGALSFGGNASALLVGELSEIVIVARLMTAPERASLQAYFAARWSL